MHQVDEVDVPGLSELRRMASPKSIKQASCWVPVSATSISGALQIFEILMYSKRVECQRPHLSA